MALRRRLSLSTTGKMFNFRKDSIHNSPSPWIATFDKKSFSRLLMDPTLLAEFKEFCKEDGGQSYTEFFIRLVKIEKLILQCRWNAPAEDEFSAQHPSLHRFLLDKNSDTEQEESEFEGVMKQIDIPTTMVSDFVKFHHDFTLSDSPFYVYITSETRNEIKKNFLAKNGLYRITSVIFDKAADEVLSLLYSVWYSRFVCMKQERELEPIISAHFITNPNTPVISNGSPHGKKSVFVTNQTKPGTATNEPIRKSRKSYTAGDGSQQQVQEIYYGRESFVHLCKTPHLYEDLRQQAQTDLSIEILHFFESYMKLESLHIQHIRNVSPNGKMEYVPVLERFLNNAPQAAPSTEAYPHVVPMILVAEFYLFFANYICNGSLYEVNLPEKVKRKITEALNSGGGGKMPFNIFDQAADDILNLLYHNTFKNLIKSKYPILSLQQNNGKGSMSPDRIAHVKPESAVIPEHTETAI